LNEVCLLASQYSLIDHANALNNIFPVARKRNVKFVIGSSLNAGFISGSPRYNYGRRPGTFLASTSRRERGCARWPQFGADLRTAALQFAAAPDVAAASIVGAHTSAQVLANVSSMQTTIAPGFWAELKRQNLIDQNAPTPASA
jgi:D-threo-aldose 1-dehydrogenase